MIARAGTFVVRMFGTFFRTKCSFIMGHLLLPVNVWQGALLYSTVQKNIPGGSQNGENSVRPLPEANASKDKPYQSILSGYAVPLL